MITKIIYITDDAREFEDLFEAKRHECDLTSHKWEYYNENMGLQPARNEKTKIRLCRHCNKQEILS